MLDDMLIEGTGGDFTPEEKIQISAGPRAYAVRIKQGREDIPTKPAICLIGYPISDSILSWIRERSDLSNNYGAVFIPHNILKGVDSSRSKAIVGNVCGCFVVRGLLPTPNLKWDASLRGYLARDGKEGIVYAALEDFHGLSL